MDLRGSQDWGSNYPNEVEGKEERGQRRRKGRGKDRKGWTIPHQQFLRLPLLTDTYNV